MNDIISSVAAGLYSAFTAFALAAQGLAGVWPHQASIVVSAGLAAGAFWLGRATARGLRVK